MKKRFITFFTLLFIMVFNIMDCSSKDKNFRINAVCYGNSMFPKRFIFHSDKSGGSVLISWMFYYIEYGDKKILIDTGFNDKGTAKMFGIKDFRDPVEILLDNRIEADSITDVIITHSHFDHIGNAHRFKNARFIINRDELSALNKSGSLKEVKKFFSGNSKVTVFDDAFTLYDTFNIRKIGGHSKGSSAVFFTYGNREYCFTGDEVYSPDNITQNIGNGSVVNHQNNMNFIEKLRSGNYTTFIMHDSKYTDSKDRFISVFPLN